MNRTFAIAALSVTLGLGFAQDKPKEKPKELPPKPLFALRLAAEAGKTTKLTLRGQRLDTATDVRVGEPKSSAKVVGKGRKTGVPNPLSAENVGDSEIDIEITLPNDVGGGSVPVSLIGPGGEGSAATILINGELPVVKEKEPNGGFAEAQPLTGHCCVEGVVRNAQDVDVYRIAGKRGQPLRIEIQARRAGSPLEAMLALSTEKGQLLAQGKIKDGDPTIEYTPTSDAPLFATVIDSNDLGESFFVYRLLVR
jgi:hypothetical protein